MSLVPTDTREAVRNFDIEAYLQKYGADQIQDYEWAMACPVCGNPDKLIVNVQKKMWHCWVCEQYAYRSDGKRYAVKGAGGLIALVQLLEGCTRARAVSIIVSGSGFSVEELAHLSSELFSFSVSDFRAQSAEPPPYWRWIDYANTPYLRKRGITEADVRDFGLFVCTDGRYANRLMFPVWEDRTLVYYQGRAMWEPHPEDKKFKKALNPTKTEVLNLNTEVLMNLDVAKNYPRVTVVEGPVDCVHVGPSCVCTFGKKISMVQALKLYLAGVRALDLMWDGPTVKHPEGTFQLMFAAAKLLSAMFDMRLILLPRDDPGIYSRDELDTFRAGAVPLEQISHLRLL